ncbi:MAG: TonB-dependent receptor [Flavobacterium sp.]|nr:TonB-dependent receptor [Flavobacterium sp.]
MKQLHRLCVALVLFCLSTTVAFAQSYTTVSGSVTNNKTQEALSAVSVTIKGGTAGTFTDDKGNFKFTTTQKPPFTLIVSSVGYANKEVLFSGSSVLVGLETSFVLGEEVVVSASRVPERILESPVSIERISSANIRQSPASNYYDIVGNMKGVDVTTSSLTFKTVSTRGFNSSGNLRLNQIMDGMDNQAPGLNFSVGSIIGLTELDVDNVELLAGASSALYGPGGMNGTLLINSKNPFKYQGLSFQIKTGVNHVDSKQRDRAPFHDWNLRWAQKLSEKWAFKIGASFTQAVDWLGNDNRNFKTAALGERTNGYVIPGGRSDSAAYDGVNVYGDETVANLGPVIGNVSRTGYNEKDVVSPLTVNVKLTGALHYKITNNLEASLTANYGIGNTVYTGLGRYSIKNFRIGQYKLELKSKNWYVRAYTTQEDAGDSYNASAATQYFNEAVKLSAIRNNTGAIIGGWFAEYAQAYSTSRSGGASDVAAHAAARTTVDAGRPTGNLLDNATFNKVISTPISKGGGLFVDKTALYMYEGQYNLTNALGLAKSGTEFLIGGNYKQYVLNSEGTLFADTAGKINIGEYGVYGQLSQKMFKDVLKLTVSGRYDKNVNFAGRFTPRASAVIKVANNQNIRVSYQQAYRFPSTQNQWIRLGVGTSTLLGGLQQLRNHVFGSAPVYNVGSNTPAVFGEFKPETATSYEVGYKGLMGKKLLLDVYAYAASYDNFISGTNVYQIVAGAPKVYQVSANSTGKVSTRGYGVSLDYLLPQNFTIGANFYSDEISDIPTGFNSFFNTPKYRTNITLTNTGFGTDKRFGFSLVYRWQDSFKYEGTFGAGTLPSVTTLDGQISYKFPATKSILKFGATNLLNKYYTNGFGNAEVGGLYYFSFAFNVF